MTGRGGKREGAGRKKGLASIKAEEARKYVVQRIVEELEPILAGQIEQAKGEYYEADDGEGLKRIYRRQPDARVAAFLITQVIGKAKETVDLNMDGAFTIKALHAHVLELGES